VPIWRLLRHSQQSFRNSPRGRAARPLSAQHCKREAHAPTIQCHTLFNRINFTLHAVRPAPSPNCCRASACVHQPCGPVRCASGPPGNRTECQSGPVAPGGARAPQTATRDVPRRKGPHCPKPVPCHARDRFPQRRPGPPLRRPARRWGGTQFS